MKNFLAAAVFALAVFFVPVCANAHSYVVRVGLIRAHANRTEITVSNTEISVGEVSEHGFLPVLNLQSAGGFIVRNSGGQIIILSGGEIKHSSSGVVHIMGANADPVTVGGYTYRGIIEFTPSGGVIQVVNDLSIEEYLFGVLPSEMAPHFHIEALKAQAVAARTYSFRLMKDTSSHLTQNFDICDTVCCQVYTGVVNEQDATTEAVYLTYGLLLLYDGVPISANYFSSSGGSTENSEDVWSQALPYLRSVNEIAEHNPLVWQRTFTWSQLTSAAANNGANIGAVNGISISNLAPSGRVLQLTLHGANGTWVVPRNVGVRGLFSGIGGTLPSRNFQITGAEHSTAAVTVFDGVHSIQAPLNTIHALDSKGAVSTLNSATIYDGATTRQIDSTPNIARGGTGITINGRGWGHGVGMSQMGAEGMARAGFTYTEILKHYYTGVEIHWY